MRRLDDATRRALLVDRQLLGPSGRADRSVTDVATAVGPLHATDPSSAVLQLVARSDASLDDIEDALYEGRALLRHTTLRRTVHLLTPDDARAAHGAYNGRLTTRLRSRLEGWLAASDDFTDDPGPWLDRLLDEVVATISTGDRPSGAELGRTVPGLQVVVDPSPGTTWSRPGRITSNVIELLVATGRIARDRPRGDWTSGAWTYGPTTDWLPEGLGDGDPAAALADLLGRRLRAYPGCSVDDLAWWTGLPKGQVRTALATVGAVEVRRDDDGVGLVGPDDDLVPSGHDPAAALLPGLDATPMGCKERDAFVGAHEAVLFDRNGNIGPTVWWDGRIVGGWTQRADGEVVARVLDDVGSDALAAVEVEATRLQDWIGDVRVNWRYPTPLQKQLEQ